MNYFFELFPRIIKFFSKREKKVIYGLLFFLVIVLFLGGFKYSENPSFCGLCHNMKEYVELLELSPQTRHFESSERERGGSPTRIDLYHCRERYQETPL
jgi:hypothetical protein